MDQIHFTRKRKAAGHRHPRRVNGKYDRRRVTDVQRHHTVRRGKSLHVAARLGNVELVELLVSSGTSPNARNGSLKTPLHEAVAHDQLAIAQILLRHGAEVDARNNNNGDTALHVAVRRQNESLVELLLDGGASPNVRNDQGLSSFETSVSWIDSGLCDMFVWYGAALSEALHDASGSVLHRAVTLGRFEVIKKVISLSRANVNVNALDSSGYHALHCLLERRDLEESEILEIVELLVDRGARVDEHNWAFETPLLVAVERGLLGIAEFLLDSGAEIHGHERNPPIRRALRSCNLEMAEWLLDRRAKLGVDALHVVVDAILSDEPPSEDRSARMIERLIERGAWVNCVNRAGESPLYRTVKGGVARFAEILLEHGAWMDESAGGGTSVLTLAVRNNDARLVTRLLECGARLHEAWEACAIYGRIELLDSLLGGARMDRGSVVLCLGNAIRQMQTDMVDYLLRISPHVDVELKVVLNYAIYNHAVAGNCYTRSGVELLVKHVALMASQKLYDHSENLKLIESTTWTREYYGECRDEIEELKATRICDNYTTTYFDFLAKRNAALVSCLRCKRINEKLRSRGYRDTFGLYADRLQAHLLWGLLLLEAQNKLESVMSDVFGKILPSVVIRNISQYYQVANF